MKLPNLASEISFGPGDATVTVPAAVPMQEPSSLLVKFAILVLETSRFHCALAQRTILTYQTNPLAFLREYHKRVGTVRLPLHGSAYVAAMIKLDEVFVPFSREVNSVYEALFPNYPMYPKFSVMRLWLRAGAATCTTRSSRKCGRRWRVL